MNVMLVLTVLFINFKKLNIISLRKKNFSHIMDILMD